MLFHIVGADHWKFIGGQQIPKVGVVFVSLRGNPSHRKIEGLREKERIAFSDDLRRHN